MSAFVQSAPRPRDGYGADWLLRSYLRRVLPPPVLTDIEPQIGELAALACRELWDFQLADRRHEPTLTHWDAWGNRIDRIELTALWREAQLLAVRYGLTALPSERPHGAWSRVHQFALVHLFHPVTDVYTCPLAMTDGATQTLRASGNAALIGRAVAHLTSRDPASFWTSGQWMTESTGGSDVGASQTMARLENGAWRLYGKKWFTSAATSQMALTLARPEGNRTGGGGLALFYVETRDSAGSLNGIRIERLKDKLGTRKLPTAELTLEGTVARLVTGTTHGTRAIEPMLRVTRAWNSVCASSFLRHGLNLARDYAVRRQVFGAPLADQPLHVATLAELDAESAAAFLLAFCLVELLGRDEGGELDETDAALLRMLTPIAKLTTGKQAAAGVSELIEAFGGAGYVEDSGIPVILRDAQVLPIWEGTTNVLALDALLRAELDVGLAAWKRRVAKACATSKVALRSAAAAAERAVEHAIQWHGTTTDPRERQAGSRRLALTLGRSLQLALLVEHASALAGTADGAAAESATRTFERLGPDRL